MEDSPENTTLSYTTSTTVSSHEESDVPKEKTETVSWDKTLSWENALNKLKLLKSIGNGSEGFVVQTGLHITIYL